MRSTTFADFRLHVEIVDVSFGSSIRLENVSLINVELEHGAVVGTTSNDDQHSLDCDLYYELRDDAGYDVDVKAVPLPDRSMLGEEFLIRNSTMSDCLYLPLADDVVLPGCHAHSADRRKSMLDRLSDHFIAGESCPNVCGCDDSGFPPSVLKMPKRERVLYMYGGVPGAELADMMQVSCLQRTSTVPDLAAVHLPSNLL